MKAKELRIGNWVDLFDSETGHNFVQVTYSLLNAENFIDPVPLTPEILEKCGFKESNNIFSKGIFECSKYDHTIQYDASIYTYRYLDNSLRDIEYLHQLQNLYFSLTGEELEIKL